MYEKGVTFADFISDFSFLPIFSLLGENIAILNKLALVLLYIAMYTMAT